MNIASSKQIIHGNVAVTDIITVPFSLQDFGRVSWAYESTLTVGNLSLTSHPRKKTTDLTECGGKRGTDNSHT